VYIKGRLLHFVPLFLPLFRSRFRNKECKQTSVDSLALTVLFQVSGQDFLDVALLPSPLPLPSLVPTPLKWKENLRSSELETLFLFFFPSCTIKGKMDSTSSTLIHPSPPLLPHREASQRKDGFTSILISSPVPRFEIRSGSPPPLFFFLFFAPLLYGG